MIHYKEYVCHDGVDRRIRAVLKWAEATFGDILVTCLGRTEDENVAVGGVENSFHLIREDRPVMAVDFKVKKFGGTGYVKRSLISTFAGIQVVEYDDFVHIEIDGDPEGKVWLKE